MMPKILLVDDDANYRKLIRETLCLSLPSLCVKEAGDGEEALRKIEACPPDIIFMDIRLPGENGLVLTQKIKINYPDVDIAILTSYDLPEYQEAALESGANYFLLKNAIIPLGIITMVQDLIDSREKNS
jgi:Response regulator containing a CheY-like receiver domain and an HTH DNA-binding domain